jgi:hypothetical protein
MPVKPVVKSMVKSTIVKAAAGKPAMKSTAVESSAGEAAVKASSGEAAVTTTTAAAVTTATATAATGQRGGRLRQAQSCHREQRNNRFPHHDSLLLLEDVAPKCINVSAAQLFEDSAVN